ncbi:hypothetical protein D9757_007067 [Collybiopsis confluens]|uniref:Uncharacterized protein n=1 Tax=Collybiopsis confluens TaxID=2823264 RepID=A0A8H5M4S6_9AGAR|nr:hypothetical protein D9757_007067 [Collybiopsis confluens]
MTQMSTSLVRTLQIMSRLSVPPKTRIVPPLPALIKTAAEKPQQSIINILTQRKAAGSWPANLRIEPIVNKAALKNVHASIRPRLKKLLKEV